MDRKRVVVTGMGAITPLGNNVETFWDGIKNNVNGIDQITIFDTTDFKVHIGAEVKDFHPENWMDKKDARRMDRFCQFGVAAAAEAYSDSGLTPESIDSERFAIIAGSGIGGMLTIEAEHEKLMNKGPNRVSPFMVPMIISNLLGGNIAIRYGAQGPCHSIVTACATGTHCIGEAFRLIAHGEADAAFAGAAEAAITPLAMAGFTNMTALSKKNDPSCSSTPFDKERDGFVMGEGGAMMILEELEHAKARGAKIYAEVVGYGSTCDAYHITSPEPTGKGAATAMKLAIQDAGITPQEVSYINAHGTGTPYNDLFETRAIKTVFGDDTTVPISSTKGLTGHMLGAAGAVEAIVCVKALMDGYIPATANLVTPDEELGLDYVPNTGRNADLQYALTNSLGFGGHNGSLLFKKWTEE